MILLKFKNASPRKIGKYKKIPFLNYHQREVVVKNLSMVKKVIPQYTMDFRPNLRLLKPDYVVHGDVWKPALKKHYGETRFSVREEIFNQYLFVWNPIFFFTFSGTRAQRAEDRSLI